MDRIIRHENNGKRRITAILLVFLVALTCTVQAESTGRERTTPASGSRRKRDSRSCPERNMFPRRSGCSIATRRMN
jgi:hypothetical protein